MVAAPRTPEQMLERYPHVLIGTVIAIVPQRRRSHPDITFDDVAVVLLVREVRKGPIGRGAEITFHGETIVTNPGDLIGPVSTVPSTLRAGATIEVYLAESAGRLIVPEWAALICRPAPGGGPASGLRGVLGRLSAP